MYTNERFCTYMGMQEKIYTIMKANYCVYRCLSNNNNILPMFPDWLPIKRRRSIHLGITGSRILRLVIISQDNLKNVDLPSTHES